MLFFLSVFLLFVISTSVFLSLIVCGRGRAVLAGSVAAAAPSMLVFLPMYCMQGAAHTGTFLVSYTLC